MRIIIITYKKKNKTYGNTYMTYVTRERHQCVHIFMKIATMVLYKQKQRKAVIYTYVYIYKRMDMSFRTAVNIQTIIR